MNLHQNARLEQRAMIDQATGWMHGASAAIGISRDALDAIARLEQAMVCAPSGIPRLHNVRGSRSRISDEVDVRNAAGRIAKIEGACANRRRVSACAYDPNILVDGKANVPAGVAGRDGDNVATDGHLVGIGKSLGRRIRD